ncbi:MAG: HD domain-containing protein [Isosphaeraceae bacterium]
MNAPSPRELISALAQVGELKSLRRAGWLRAGVPEPESVAAHSFRAILLAFLLAPDLGVDPDRLCRLLLVHDLAESDPAVGDITPHCGISRDEKRRLENDAMIRLCRTLPRGDEILALWKEYDEGSTLEAALAHQIDALDMGLQAREYQQRTGLDLDEFVHSALQRISHPALRALLEA